MLIDFSAVETQVIPSFLGGESGKGSVSSI